MTQLPETQRVTTVTERSYTWNGMTISHVDVPGHHLHSDHRRNTNRILLPDRDRSVFVDRLDHHSVDLVAVCTTSLINTFLDIESC
jgi:hypothetical protein